jgi:hypothetical protein
MRHKLKPSDVVYILTSTDSAVSLATELKVSRQCINQVRLGKVYAKVAPSIPRWRPQTKMCRSCAHWENDACAFDFPEAGLNSRFASECSLFVESKKQD